MLQKSLQIMLLIFYVLLFTIPLILLLFPVPVKCNSMFYHGYATHDHVLLPVFKTISITVVITAVTMVTLL